MPNTNKHFATSKKTKKWVIYYNIKKYRCQEKTQKLKPSRSRALFLCLESGTRYWNKDAEQGARVLPERSTSVAQDFCVVPLFAFLVPPPKIQKSIKTHKKQRK